MTSEFVISRLTFPTLAVVTMLLLSFHDCDERMKRQGDLWMQTCAHNCPGGYLMENQRCLCLQGGQGGQGAAAAPTPTLGQPESEQPTPEQAGPAPEQAGPALPKPVAPRGDK